MVSLQVYGDLGGGPHTGCSEGGTRCEIRIIVLALKISEIAGTPVSAEGLEFIAAEELAG